MVQGLSARGLRGQALFVKEQRLRHGQPAMVEIGPYEELEWLPGPGYSEGDLAEVDRLPREGWVWVVQRATHMEPKAITVWVKVRRPGQVEHEECRLVLLCEGGAGGAHR